MPGIQFSFATSLAIVIPLVLAAIVVAVFFYRHTLPPVSMGKRLVLTILRSLILILLLCLLCEPLLHLVYTSTRKPVLAILVDNTRSMGLTDRSGSRAAILRAAVGGRALASLTGRAEVRRYTVGTQLRESRGTDTLSLDEDATDLSTSLRMMQKERDRLGVNAAILFTDGSYNLGRNPLYDAQELAIPVYTVGIGDSSEQKDILITKVVANDIVYSDALAPVDVTVKSSGFEGQRVELTISSGSKELQRTQLLLAGGTREYPVHMAYIPEGEGTQKYTVRVSNLPGELTLSNNQQFFFARVLKSKLRILLLSGDPGPDFSVLRQTLAEEPKFSLNAFCQRSPSGFYEGMLTRAIADSSDCLVFLGMPTGATSPATLDLISSCIIQNRKPLLYIDGKSVDRTRLNLFSSVLPFVTVQSSSSEVLVSFQPSDAQRGNSLLTLGSDQGFGAWLRLPPIFRTQTIFRAKPEAVVLGTGRILNVPVPDPLMLTRSLNRQKTLALLGYGVWRWRLMAQGNPETAQLFSSFLSAAIQWLTTPDDHKPVKVTSTKDVFAQGEPVEFTGQVYDAGAKPLDNASIKVVAQREGELAETDLQPIGGGRYEGKIEGLGEGDYTFHATAQLDGAPLGDDNGKFSVGALNLEFQDTRMNAPLLREIAYRTGGRFLMPEELGGLDSLLGAQSSFTPTTISQTRDIELWNWQFILGLIIFLLAAEWFIRKRSGML